MVDVQNFEHPDRGSSFSGDQSNLDVHITSAYVSPHHVSIRPRTSAYVRTRQHTSPYTCKEEVVNTRTADGVGRGLMVLVYTVLSY